MWCKSVCVFVYQPCCKNLTASSIIQRSFWVYLVCSAQFPRLCASAGPRVWVDETWFLSSFIVLSLTLFTLSVSCFHLFTLLFIYFFFQSSDLCLAKWAVLHCWRIRSQHVDQVNHNADVQRYITQAPKKSSFYHVQSFHHFLITISNVGAKKCSSFDVLLFCLTDTLTPSDI